MSCLRETKVMLPGLGQVLCKLWVGVGTSRDTVQSPRGWGGSVRLGARVQGHPQL